MRYFPTLTLEKTLLLASRLCKTVKSWSFTIPARDNIVESVSNTRYLEIQMSNTVDSNFVSKTTRRGNDGNGKLIQDGDISQVMSTGKLLEFLWEGEWHSKVECDNYGRTTRFCVREHPSRRSRYFLAVFKILQSSELEALIQGKGLWLSVTVQCWEMQSLLKRIS